MHNDFLYKYCMILLLGTGYGIILLFLNWFLPWAWDKLKDLNVWLAARLRGEPLAQPGFLFGVEVEYREPGDGSYRKAWAQRLSRDQKYIEIRDDRTGKLVWISQSDVMHFYRAGA